MTDIKDMTVMELLVSAAKAAKIRHLQYDNGYDGREGLLLVDEIGRKTKFWNPLSKEGDALRLAATLGLDVEMHGCVTNFPYATAYNHERNIAQEWQP